MEHPFGESSPTGFFYIWKANKDQDVGQGDHGEFPNWWDDVQTPPLLELERGNGTNSTGDGISIVRRGARGRL